MVTLMGDQFLVFTGRPNAGKSSIIRAVTGLKVEVGKDPGTTQRINRYPIAEGLTLIDMPGYGRSLRGGRGKEEETKDDILDFLELNAGSIALAVHVVNISTFLETEMRLAKKGFIPLDVEMVHFLKRDLGIHRPRRDEQDRQGASRLHRGQRRGTEGGTWA